MCVFRRRRRGGKFFDWHLVMRKRLRSCHHRPRPDLVLARARKAPVVFVQNHAQRARGQGATAGFVTHSRPDVYHKPCLFIARVAAISRSDSGQKLQQMDNQQQQANPTQQRLKMVLAALPDGHGLKECNWQSFCALEDQDIDIDAEVKSLRFMCCPPVHTP